MGRGSSGATQGQRANRRQMPELTGTEKQVAWANDIRKRAISGADNALRDTQHADKAEKESIKKYGFAATTSRYPTPTSVKEARDEYIAVIQEATAAKDFIDVRERFTERKAREMVLNRAHQIDEQKRRKKIRY